MEKLHRASILLATSDGPLRVRLVRAWERAAGDVLVEHMPKGLGIEWGDLLDEMKAAGPQGDDRSTFAASVERMPDEKVLDVARRLIILALDFYRQAPPLRRC